MGEEADLGVIVFLALFFFLPHSLCIAAMSEREGEGNDPLLPMEMPRALTAYGSAIKESKVAEA